MQPTPRANSDDRMPQMSASNPHFCLSCRLAGRFYIPPPPQFRQELQHRTRMVLPLIPVAMSDS